MNFPERLEIVIKKSNLKKEGFAELTGVGKRQLFNYLGGSSEPTRPFLVKVRESFPWVDLEWLISGKSALVVREQETDYTVDNDLRETLQRILKEGDPAKEKVLRSMLAALDPGKK